MITKRDDIMGGITETLNSELETGPDACYQDHTLKLLYSGLLRGKDDEVACLSRCIRTTTGKTRVTKEHYDKYRKTVAALFSGLVLPIWSRWLSFGASVNSILLCTSYGLLGVCGRVFGSQISIKGDRHDTRAVFGEDDDETVFLLLFLLTLSILLQPLDRVVSGSFRVDSSAGPTRREMWTVFHTWNEEAKSYLRDTGRFCREMEIILQRVPRQCGSGAAFHGGGFGLERKGGGFGSGSRRGTVLVHLESVTGWNDQHKNEYRPINTRMNIERRNIDRST